jgi:hypothetical protein
MQRHDCRPPVAVAKLHMAPPLADLFEPRLTKGSDDVGSGRDRKPRTHAAISTEAMIGGSFDSGNGASSK